MDSSALSRREDPLEKTGYRIPRSLAAMVREAMDAGEARSQNELVERALRREVRIIRQRRLYDEYARAARSPAFTEEMGDIAPDWSAALGDGLADEDS